MAKSRNFSIYLLKEGYDCNNSLKDEHGLVDYSDRATELPEGGSIFVANTPSTQPWWKNYWGVDESLIQAQKGAIVFLSVGDRDVALTFGMTYHKLLDNCYEYDFGIRTTLNALDPEKIKSTDILVPESAKRERIQSPKASNLTFFDINQDESIVKKLTGAVKEEYSELFTNVTGASNIKVSSKADSNELVRLCEELLSIYESEEYLQSFPDIQNIVPVKDPQILELLNTKLLEAFQEAPVELVLSVPDIIDYSSSFRIKYQGAGRSSEEKNDVFIGGYREYLTERNSNDIEDIEEFKKHQLSIIDENGRPVKKFSIYKCFLFECEIENEFYHLCEGEWYHIERDYLNRLASSLDPLFLDSHPILQDCNEHREDDYNLSVSTNHQNVFCLDKKNISPSRQTAVEPCDLLTITDDWLQFIHVKISTRSSSLSHLFNQGINSAVLLRMQEESRDKLKELVNNDVAVLNSIELNKYSVIYGIVTKKNATNKSKNLPIFSRISLLRVVNNLKMMNIPCSVYFIKDEVDRRGNQGVN